MGMGLQNSSLHVIIRGLVNQLSHIGSIILPGIFEWYLTIVIMWVKRIINHSMFDNLYHPSMVVWYWLWWFDGIISTTLSQHIRDLRRIADRLAELIWTADLWAASPMLRKAGPGQETQPELGMVKSWSKFSSPCRLVPPYWSPIDVNVG